MHRSLASAAPPVRPAIVGAIAAAVIIGLLALFAGPADASQGVIGHTVGKGESSGARQYWTPKRMHAADDLQLDRAATPAQLRAAAPIADAAVSGPVDPGKYSNFRPAHSRPGKAPTVSGRNSAGRYEVPPYVSGAVDGAATSVYPYSANGKLFGTFRRLGGYSCSATVVNSGSHNVILTAGHCLYDENAGWARHVVFIPAYEDGARPFGGWSASYITTPRGWARGDFHRDYGAVKLTSAGNPIGTVVGEEGLAWNQPREQLFQAIGYPFNLGKTEFMWNCFSGFGGIDPQDRRPAQADSGIGCDMSSGASGGGWTIRDSFGNPFVNGVTSYGYKQLKNVLFAAYFNGKVVQTVNTADRHR